jgi:rare lipoprotein A
MTTCPRLPLVLLAAGFLAGCAGHAPSPKSAGQPAANSGLGVYKIGTPYEIAGVWYRPAEDFAYDETGIASWYGEDFHGKYTANGEVFDLNALTAAHRTLPMPTVVQVTNLDNGRSIALRVNDRGPFARGRIIDVSRRAAQLLGFEGPGTAKVRVRIMVPETIQAVALARRNGGDERLAEEAPQAAPREAVTAEALAPAPTLQFASTETAPMPRPPMPAAPAQAVAPAPVAVPPASAAAAPALSDQVTVLPVQPSQIYIQAGAFARADNAVKVKARLDAFGPVKIYGARVNGIDLYRVRLGPVGSVDEADKLLGRVVETGLAEARIVVD